MQSKSPMFQENKAYRPFLYPWAVELAKKHEQVHWVEDEVTLEDDIADWKRGKVNECEKSFITNVLRLFTQSDVSVGGFYHNHLIPTFKNNEIRNMLSSFAAREAIHQRAYALLTDSLGLMEAEYSAFLEYKQMKDKIEFMGSADVGTQEGLGFALAHGTFNEGISLFASFAMLLNFQRRGLMRGCGKIVEWSIRDESLHVEGVSKLFRDYVAEHPRIVNDEFKKAIYEDAKQCVKLEDKFIELAFKNCQIEGVTEKEVQQYIRYIADRRLIQLGLKGIFKVKDNPISWLETLINAKDHTNFFEGRVVSYEAAGLKGEWSY
jgi:glutaredoxin 3